MNSGNAVRGKPMSTWLQMRAQYLSAHFTGNVRRLADLAGVGVQERRYDDVPAREDSDWGKFTFHVHNRISTPRQLAEMLPEFASRLDSIEQVVGGGFRLSILPLNCILGPEVYRQFVPPDDFFQPHDTKSVDPYGIHTDKARVVKLDGGTWLGSRKFQHTLLVNTHGCCPIGCSDCYKSYHTREGHASEMGMGDVSDGSVVGLKVHAGRLIAWLNANPEVYDVVISGGEPLVSSNHHIRTILNSLRKAKHLRILRFCTGTLFLGLPFRFDDRLLDLMEEFEQDTAIRIRIHAHLSNWTQISPEAVIAISRIRKRGIAIYTQVPIREGLNYFSEDSEKTIDYFVRMGRTQAILGVNPYMFIADMHPRTNQYYVALEPLLKLWCRLVESHENPGIERPRSLSILFEHGNIILSGALMLAIHKSIDKDRNLVIYRIPSPRFLSGEIYHANQGNAFFTYREPLIAGQNDDCDSLSNLQERWFKLPKDRE